MRPLPLVVALALAGGLVVAAEPQPVAADPLPSTPTLYITPDCFVADGIHQITIHGRNFARNSLVDVVDFVNYRTEDARTQVTTSNYGTFNTELNVTANTYFYYNQVRAYYAGSDVELATAFVGSCGTDSEVRAVSTCGDPENPGIRVTGARWAAPPTTSQPLRIGLYQGDQLIGVEAQFPAAETWDYTFQPGVALAAGEYTIKVYQFVSSFEVEYFGYDEFHVPCPQVTISPDCSQIVADPGTMKIFVSGVGFIPRTGGEGEGEIQVVFEPNNEPQEFFYFNVDGLAENGSFDSLEINPYGRPAGAYTIQVKQQGFGNNVRLEQTVEFNVPCFEPVLTIDDDCGPPEIVGDEPRRYSIEVSGTDFAPGLPVTITFDPDGRAGPDYPPETFEDQVGRDRTFGRKINPAFRPPGTYRVVARQEIGLIVNAAPSASFLVPCALPNESLTLDPPCGSAAANVPDAYRISVTGTGFALGRVDLAFDPGGVSEAGSASADEDGTFKTEMVVDGRPPGVYYVVARQSTVLGTFAEKDAPFIVSCEGALLRITPASGPRGFVPLVEGFNFREETTLNLRWDYGIGAGRPILVDTDINGTFNKQVLIFHGDFIGERHMTIELPEEPAKYADLSATYLVVPDTASPPFVVDNPFTPPDQIVVLR